MPKLILPLFLLISVVSFSQSKVDNIIDKVIQTLGGKEKLQSIASIIKNGSGDANGVKYPVNYYAIKNKSERSDFTFNGMTGYQIITKDSGFNFSPFSGMASAEKMTDEDIKLSSDELDLEGSIVNYSLKGHTVELMENEDVDGVDAIQIKENLKNGKTIFYFIDPDTYFIIRTTTTGVSNGQEFKSTSNYYDFKKTKEGILFPYIVDNVIYKEININTPIDEKLFSTKK